jgi:dipeptidyl aminopeptidase/acylaminoacyl peptidase
VWVSDTAAGKAINLTGGRGTSWGGVWSPDGRHLAFYSDRDGAARVWLWAADGGELRRVSDVVVRPLFGYEVPAWTPDSRGLVVKVMPAGETVATIAERTHGRRPTVERLKDGAATVEVFRAPVVATTAPVVDWTNRYLSDLAVLDVATGGVRRLAPRVKALGCWLSPDGAALAFAEVRELTGQTDQSLGFDLRAVSLAGGPVRTLAAGVPTNMGREVSWSPDSRYLAYQSGGLARGSGDCFVVSAAGGEPVLLTPAPHPSFDNIYLAPLWTTDGKRLLLIGGGETWASDVASRTVAPLRKLAGRRAVALVEDGGRVWSPDGGRSAVVLASANDTRQMSWHWLDLRTGATTLLWEGERAVDGVFRLSGRVTPQGPRLLFAAEGAAQPPDLHMLSVNDRSVRRVTTVNPQLDGRAFGTSRLVRWKSDRGEKLAGTLLLPPGHKAGDRHPLVVRVYPGDDPSTDVFRFGAQPLVVHNQQLLATRGFAVFLPDIPQPRGKVVDRLMAAVLPGVDAVVQSGVIDPERVGVMGHSFGGYAALALATRSDRFRAVVASAPYADVFAMWGQAGPEGSAAGAATMEMNHRMGPPWGRSAAYVAESPAYHLDKVKAPVLLLHGSLDETCPVAQSEAVFVGLRKLGRRVEFARYAGEDHSPLSWGTANVRDYWSRTVGWFEDHLKVGR